MLYMPDPEVAAEVMSVAPYGRLLRFAAYGPPRNSNVSEEAYAAVVEGLAREGSHRNVYLVDDSEAPVWRVADYKVFEGLPDAFVGLDATTSPDVAKGTTFHGHIFEINLHDGSLTKIGWTK